MPSSVLTMSNMLGIWGSITCSVKKGSRRWNAGGPGRRSTSTAKTVLPAHAGAKFSFRLVPNQDVTKIAESLKKYLQDICPPGIQMQLIDRHGAPGFVLPLDSPYIKAAAKAIEQGFQTAPVFIRSGGSIPVVNTFSQQLGLDSLLLGWGQDDDNPHSPNEKFSLDDFYHGTRSSAWLWPALAEVATKAET